MKFFKYLVFYVVLFIGLSSAALSKPQSKMGMPKTAGSPITPNSEPDNTVIKLWNANFENEYLKEALGNILDLSVSRYGPYQIVSSNPLGQQAAHDSLVTKNIDLMVSAASSERESATNPIFVPLYRGLLGFRVCLINQRKSSFTDVKTASQFIERDLTIGLGNSWPDKRVYQSNQFKVITADQYEQLFDMLAQDQFDCLSRGVFEVEEELERYAHIGIELDDSIIFIYPNSSIMYVNKNNTNLYRRLMHGLDLALQNGSFYDIFDAHFKNLLIKKGIYERHIFLLENNALSEKSVEAINEYGIASFVIGGQRQSGDG